MIITMIYSFCKLDTHAADALKRIRFFSGTTTFVNPGFK